MTVDKAELHESEGESQDNEEIGKRVRSGL